MPKSLPRYLLVGASLLLLVPAALVVSQEQEPKAQAVFLVKPYLQLPTPSSITVMWETELKLAGRVEYGTTRDLGKVAQAPMPKALHEVTVKGLQPGTNYHYRVGSGDLVSDIYTFKTAPLPGTKRWRLAFYGDSRSNPGVHRKIAEQISKAKVDLIVHSGDIVLHGGIRGAWRLEFFDPLGPLARSVPWVSTIGNHERDNANYFSYVALPGNERYFGFDYGNAHFVCLDSNAWIERGRDSAQFKWLTEHLRQKRDATWTFVVFHHSLFSAHATRPINTLRWEWAPLLLDPANKVDGVLTGHDHFYARNYRMGRVGEKADAGVLFLTSAGGGAALYPTKQRDYVAKVKGVHHFALMEFEGDKIQITAIDKDGTVFDKYTLTKEPAKVHDFCAYEIEELRLFLRKGLTAAPMLKTAAGKTHFASSLQVPTRFRVPITGELRWQEVAGWRMKQAVVPFRLAPNQPLEVPLQAEVESWALSRGPELTIAFEEGKFRNRTIQLHPFKLAGPEKVTLTRVNQAVALDGKLTDPAWQKAGSQTLVSLAPETVAREDRGDQIRLLADAEWLYVGARLSDPSERVQVTPPDPDVVPSPFVFYDEHLHVVLSDGKQMRSFAVTPESVRYCACDRKEDVITKWRAVVGRVKDAWCVEMALPRKLFADTAEVGINVVRHRRVPAASAARRFADAALCPTYEVGGDPDLLPDWFSAETVDRFARLVVE